MLAYPLFLPHPVRAMNAPNEGYATRLRRLAPFAFRIDDPEEREAFLRGEVAQYRGARQRSPNPV